MDAEPISKSGTGVPPVRHALHFWHSRDATATNIATTEVKPF
jgi:hypothetical protein